MKTTVHIHPQHTKESACQKTNHLAIVAHQDDAEIIGYSGIQQCYLKESDWFSSITLTNGSGASRGGRYANLSDTQLSAIRQSEQIKAAQIGDYAFCIQWDISSKELKEQMEFFACELSQQLATSRPDTIYTHCPTDKHSTHRVVCEVVITAIRKIMQSDHHYKPTIYGVEVWGSLDWVPKEFLVELDCSPMANLEQALIGIYDSQIDGNKGYDKAVLGRRMANATFNSSHNSDSARSLNLAIELTPLLSDQSLTISSFLAPILEAFSMQTLAHFNNEK
ncbi:PIG-L deacetylase family protein [Litoribacillus peritrichatus]|uniref:PIG-L family deacetylase n=1 Tax=Litoribacillus peritrichatus TaxID=718191 RepID=A0ABP7N1X4_9GAMM